MSDEDELNQNDDENTTPSPAAQPQSSPKGDDEEWIPKSLMISRLAEKERKHKREKDELRKQMENPVMQNQDNAIQQQAAQNVVQSMTPQQPMQQQGMPQGMPQGMQQGGQQVTPDMLQQVAKTAIEAHEQSKLQSQLEAKRKAESQEYIQAQQNTMAQIEKGMQDDPELKDLLNNTKLKDADGFTTNLLQHLSLEQHPTEILKKIMSNPEHIAAFQNASMTHQGQLVRKLANEVQSEKLKGLTPTPQSQFASRGGSPIQKRPEDMDYEDYRDYVRGGRK